MWPVILARLLAAPIPVQAQTAVEHVIHGFANFPHGAVFYGTLARDSAGDVYGTTNLGGTAYAASDSIARPYCGGAGCA